MPLLRGSAATLYLNYFASFQACSARACRSTLLKAIGQGLVVGFPKNIRALYVDQLEGVDDHSTVLEVVMSADKEVITWRQQAQLLEVRGPPCACMQTPLLRSHPLLLSPISKQLNIPLTDSRSCSTHVNKHGKSHVVVFCRRRCIRVMRRLW